MKPEGRNPVDPRIVKALGHPLRMQLLAMLNLKVSSPKELADELGERLPNVSYHVRVLLDAGCIELVKTVPRRGAVEHFYRAQVRPYFSDEDWAKLPSSTRQSVSDSVLRAVWDDIADATRSGLFDAREDRHLSRSKLVLDEQGWSELNELLVSVLDRAHELQAESLVREHGAEDGHAGVFSNLVMMHYAANPAGDESPPAPRARAAKSKRAVRAAS